MIFLGLFSRISNQINDSYNTSMMRKQSKPEVDCSRDELVLTISVKLRYNRLEAFFSVNTAVKVEKQL